MPHRGYDSPTVRAYRLAIPALRKVFGGDWSEEHVEYATVGLLRNDQSTMLAKETHRMRCVILAEMLWNLQDIDGYDSCIALMKQGQVESTYAVLEIARMLYARNIVFRFVKPIGKRGSDYDLDIFLPDGVKACGEAKCKLEDTEITLATVRDAFDTARTQLPKNEPGIVFVKVPRQWLDDLSFAQSLTELAMEFLRSTDRIVSAKYHTAAIIFEADLFGERTGEIVAHHEVTSPHVDRRFPHLKGKDWTLFPENVPPPPARTSFNGMPVHWKRLFFFR